MIQVVPTNQEDGPYDCSYCGYSDMQIDCEGAYILSDHPGYYFCSNTCAEDWQEDFGNE